MATKEFEKLSVGAFSSMAGETELLAYHAPWVNSIELLLRHIRPGVIGERSVAIATNIEFRTVEEGEDMKDLAPTFRLSPEKAQTLMDELWKCGVRPSKDWFGPGELASTKEHLKDMRALVAQALEIEW